MDNIANKFVTGGETARFELDFLNDTNERRRLIIRHPDIETDGETVRNTMDEIIELGILDTRGLLRAPIGARITESEDTIILDDRNR